MDLFPPPSPLPLPSPSPSLFVPSPCRAPNQLGSLGERCKLPQRGPGQTPDANACMRVCMYFEPRKRVRLQQNCFYVWQSSERSGDVFSSHQRSAGMPNITGLLWALIFIVIACVHYCFCVTCYTVSMLNFVFSERYVVGFAIEISFPSVCMSVCLWRTWVNRGFLQNLFI